MRRAIVFILAVALVSTGYLLASRHRHSPAAPVNPPGAETAFISLAGNTMGGTWSVKLRSLPPGILRESLKSSVADLLARMDGEMSIWKSDSDLSRFNQYRGNDWFAVPRELADVVVMSRMVSVQTAGTFDATIGPLVLLWGFGPLKSGGQIGRIPSGNEITNARAHVGFRSLEVRSEPPALRKSDPAVYVDLGGIAKGYAAEAVADKLTADGATDYLVAIGGELRARGESAQGHPWRVGIETPTPDIRRVFYSLDLKDQSLSTSGDYHNFLEIDGQRYCHEIDPRSGRPIPAGLASVSVVHPSGAYADAMATALMVLGPRDGYDLAMKLKLAVLFIVRQPDHFDILKTPGFEKLNGAQSDLLVNSR